VPDVFDADGAWLRPVDGQASERHSDFEPTPVEEPLLAQTAAAALETDSITTLDDMATKRSTAMTASAPADTPAGPADRATANTGEKGQSCRYRSLLCVPVDDGLTLEVGAESPNVFGDADRQAGEILAAHLGTALDRVAVEKELRRERDRLDEFAGLVSHDLRNPLTVALGRLSLVRDRLDEPQVDTAYQALERMETLIEDLLTLARQDKTIDNPGPVALAAVAADARQTAAVDGATIEIADDLPTVEGDRSRLQQLFENCFRNAIDHNDPPVTVTVGSFSDGFFIADDGAGIPPDERTAVLESGYSSTAGGSGFGLAIVARIAEAHGWDVQITESEQGGARFEFVDDGAVD
jgi:signal transduction histidine kinase